MYVPLVVLLLLSPLTVRNVAKTDNIHKYYKLQDRQMTDRRVLITTTLTAGTLAHSLHVLSLSLCHPYKFNTSFIVIVYPLTVRVVGAQQMILQHIWT